MTIPKYRAYIKATGEMRLVTVLGLWAQTVEAIPLKKKTKTSYLSKMKFYSFDEIELMQYLSFEDINKIEVYDCDVLSFDNISHDGHTFHDFGHIKRDLFTTIKIFNQHHYTLFLDDVNNIEIIGNLHQHPELLNEKTKNE